MEEWPQRERAPEDIIREMREMALGTDKASDEEFEASEGKHSQFGNNFYNLFLVLKTKEPKAISGQQLLDKAESLGSKWGNFIEENRGLIERINLALEKEELYRKLLSKHIELLKKGDYDLAESISSELHLESIGIAAWNALNPLLEEAAAKMREYDIDPVQFFGQS